MKIINHLVIISLAVASLGSLQAAEKNKPMDPAMQEAMKKGAPGEQHKALEPFVGKFTTTCRMWMKPGEEPKKSMGTSEHTWILGGRFLKMTSQGDMDGQHFEGLGYLGYDNIRAEYTSVWLDNMNTGIGRGTGQYDVATKTYNETGTFSCPMTGEKDMKFRAEWKVIDKNNLIYTMYQPGTDGKEMKGMEVSYKRMP